MTEQRRNALTESNMTVFQNYKVENIDFTDGRKFIAIDEDEFNDAYWNQVYSKFHGPCRF